MAKAGLTFSEYTPTLDGRLPVSNTDVLAGPVYFDNIATSLQIAVGGRAGIGGVIKAGNITATFVFEQSSDGGNSWSNSIVLFGVFQVLGSSAVAGGPAGDTIINFIIGNGITHVRIRLSAYTSGSATVFLQSANNASALSIGALAAGFVGQTYPFFANVIGGGVITGGSLPTAVTTGTTARIFADAYGRLSTFRKDTWAIQQQPAVATQATISRAAGAAGVRNVCTSITISISSTAAPTAGSVIFNLRDGATGAGTILWSCRLSIPAVAGNAQNVTISNLWIEGTAATAMTLESSAAPAAGTFATVAMSGTTTQ